MGYTKHMENISLTPAAQNLPLGEYQHYKGGRYTVLRVGIHSETLEELVVYQAQYGDKLIWIRPLAMFFETVDVDGAATPRFKYLGDSHG